MFFPFYFDSEWFSSNLEDWVLILPTTEEYYLKATHWLIDWLIDLYVYVYVCVLCESLGKHVARHLNWNPEVCLQSPSFLSTFLETQEGLPSYCWRLAAPKGSKESSATYDFVYVLGIQIQVLILTQEALYLLNHILRFCTFILSIHGEICKKYWNLIDMWPLRLKVILQVCYLLFLCPNKVNLKLILSKIASW